MRKKEFAAKVWSKLILHERRHGLLKRGDRVVAAVSGGPDSVCLAHFLSVLSRKRGFSLSLLHVHHGLRGRAADADERFVLALGEKLKVPAHSVRVAVAQRAAERGKGLEDAGRELRYNAFLDNAKKDNRNKVATGHQADDQAETVLLNLMRGTRLSALGGIPPKRPLSDRIQVIRPLLPISRDEIMAYLRVHGLKHRVDKTNASPRFTRNWLRGKVLPLLATRQPRVREHLAGIAEQVRALSDKG